MRSQNEQTGNNMNREWHSAHRMPKNATLDQRIAWHIAHSKNCHCRDMPQKIKEEISKRKLII